MPGTADGQRETEKETLQAREEEKEREGAAKAAAWPLEGFPGSFWFLALMRRSCVPAHGPREAPRVLM